MSLPGMNFVGRNVKFPNYYWLLDRKIRQSAEGCKACENTAAHTNVFFLKQFLDIDDRNHSHFNVVCSGFLVSTSTWETSFFTFFLRGFRKNEFMPHQF